MAGKFIRIKGQRYWIDSATGISIKLEPSSKADPEYLYEVVTDLMDKDGVIPEIIHEEKEYYKQKYEDMVNMAHIQNKTQQETIDRLYREKQAIRADYEAYRSDSTGEIKRLEERIKTLEGFINKHGGVRWEPVEEQIPTSNTIVKSVRVMKIGD